MSENSPAQFLASLTEKERESLLSSLTNDQKQELRWHWPFWARPSQLTPPGDWDTWLVLAGRGFGKTRMGSEWIRKIARENPGCRIALVAETAADARDVMVLGDSGLINCDPTLTKESWSPTNRCVTWPNGSRAWCYNATEPDQLRGPQHHFAWVDELAKFRYMQATWDQVQFGLRLGEKPQVLVTTTPQPKPLIKELVANEGKGVYVTRGSTLDNKDNLAASTVRNLYDRYGNTRLGRQELEGEILGDIPGALWKAGDIDEHRIPEDKAPDMERIIVAVDPAASSNEGSDENGIVGVGLARDPDGYARGYVLADASLRGTPEEWARAAVRLYRELNADRIVAEKNNGGEMVASVIRSIDRSVPVTLVHASRGKYIRAEPISALYEQGRVHHVGQFKELESQMCMFSVDNLRDANTGSPDRVDALVWGLSQLFEKIVSRKKVSKEEPASFTGNSQYSQFTSSGGWYSSPTSWMQG